MDHQALDHPLHTSIGKNGTNVNLPGYSGKPVSEKFIEKDGKEAYADFYKETLFKG